MLEKRNMNYNFNMVIPRLEDAFNHLDEEKAKYILENIKHSCLCVGTGGSNAVSLFTSIILEETNNIIAISKEPRDVLYMNLSKANYCNLFGITYGNNNYGINEVVMYAKENNCVTNKLTANNPSKDDIYYGGVLPLEDSFISIASTILPMSIMLNYYLKQGKKETLKIVKNLYDKIENISFDLLLEDEFTLFEIMSGDDTYVASKILESTITEAGLGIPVVHEKYGYCHGRSTLSHVHQNSNLIYLINSNSNIDIELLDELRDLYKNIVILESASNDKIVGEFDLSIQALMLCKFIAEQKNKDLSIVNYSPVVKKLYKYNGRM